MPSFVESVHPERRKVRLHILCTEENILNTENVSRLSCANSSCYSWYQVKNIYIYFSEISCFISFIFPVLSLGFYCDKKLQELPLVHEVIFRKHMYQVCKAYRLEHPLCVFNVMTSNSLDWKLIGSGLFEAILYSTASVGGAEILIWKPRFYPSSSLVNLMW